jgi:hypothetical protein
LRIARYANAQDNVPVPEDVTWPALVSLLTTHHRSRCPVTPCSGKCSAKNGAAWSPADVEGRRLNDNVRAITSAVFDLDHIPEPVCEGVIRRVLAAGYAFIVHSTHSHRPPENCCLRLVLPLSRPVLPKEWPIVRMAVIRQLEIPADPGVKDLSRLYYLPDAPVGTDPIAGSGEGRALDVDALLESGRAGVIKPATAPAAIDLPPVEGQTDLDELRRLLRKVTRPESKELVRRILSGEPIAPLGQQDTTLQRVASLVTFVLPTGTPEDAVIEILRPSLQATEWLDGYDHLVEQTKLKLRRASSGKVERDAKREQESRELGEARRRAPSTPAASVESPRRTRTPTPRRRPGRLDA